MGEFRRIVHHSGPFGRRRSANRADRRRNVPQLARAHQDRNRGRVSALFRRADRQYQTVSDEHRRSGGFHDHSGFGQHHGDVDSRADSRNRRIEDARFHGSRDSDDDRFRGDVDCGCRRFARRWAVLCGDPGARRFDRRLLHRLQDAPLGGTGLSGGGVADRLL